MSETSEDFGVWLAAQKKMLLMDSRTQYEECFAEARTLMTLIGKDSDARRKLYDSLPLNEKRVVKSALGDWHKGVLHMRYFDQPKDDWTSALAGAFALRKQINGTKEVQDV